MGGGGCLDWIARGAVYNEKNTREPNVLWEAVHFIARPGRGVPNNFTVSKSWETRLGWVPH